MVWKTKKISVYKWIKYILIIGCLLGIVISIVIININMKKESYKTVKKIVYEYSYSPITAYNVKLSENKYYDNPIRNEGEKYIRNLISSVDVVFGGNFQGNRQEDITVNYQVKAKLEGYQVSSGNKDIIWEKDMPLKESYTENINDYSWKYEITEKIDLDQYEAMVANIKGELGITLSVNLIIYIDGDIIVHRDDSDIKIPIDSNVKIPLNNTLFSIEKNRGESINRQEFIKVKEKMKKDYTLIIVSLVFIVFAFICEIVVIFFIDIKEDMPTVIKEEKRILKKYRSRMIALCVMPQLQIDEIYIVGGINDLFRVSEDLGRPVFYLMGKDREIDSGKIFVTDGGEKYIYYI